MKLNDNFMYDMTWCIENWESVPLKSAGEIKVDPFSNNSDCNIVSYFIAIANKKYDTTTLEFRTSESIGKTLIFEVAA